MEYIPTIKYVPSGNKAACANHIKFAINQLDILERQMEISNLAIPGSITEGVRRRSPFPGVYIECISSFSNHEIRIHVEPKQAVISQPELRKRKEFKEAWPIFANIPLLAVKRNGEAYLLYFAAEDASTVFRHPFKKVKDILPQDTVNFVQHRKGGPKVFTTLSVGANISEFKNGYVLLQTTTCKGFSSDLIDSDIKHNIKPINLYTDIFSKKVVNSLVHSTVTFIDTGARKEYTTNQSLFYSSRELVANISSDGNTLYIVAGGDTLYIYDYDIETKEWTTLIDAISVLASVSYKKRTVTHIDENGYAYGYSKNETISPNPDYIPNAAPALIAGDSIESKNMINVIYQETQYKVFLPDILSYGLNLIKVDGQIKAYGPTTVNKDISSLYTIKLEQSHGVGWGRSDINASGFSEGGGDIFGNTPVGPSYVPLGVSANRDILGVPSYYLSCPINYYPIDTIAWSPPGTGSSIDLIKSSLVGVDIKGNNTEEYNGTLYSNSQFYYTYSTTDVSHGDTWSNGGLYVGTFEHTGNEDSYSSSGLIGSWPTISMSRKSVTRRYISERRVYIGSPFIQGTLGCSFVSSELGRSEFIGPEYAKCLSPLIIEDAVPVAGFTSSCTDDAKKIGHPTSTLIGVKYYNDSDAHKVVKWKIEIDGVEIHDELFVDKYVPPTQYPEELENWTAEFVEDDLAYICYLF